MPTHLIFDGAMLGKGRIRGPTTTCRLKKKPLTAIEKGMELCITGPVAEVVSTILSDKDLDL